MEEVLNFIKNNNMVKRGDIIGVGVSGGADSMALLHILNELSSELDVTIYAIHVNHGIREESAEEEEFVEEECKAIGVKFYRFRVDAPKFAEEKKLSLETAAREVRYNVFEALIKKGVVDKIALAHHQDDQAETLLMHLFRGSGMQGAKGMTPVRDDKYIRPLLELSKKQLENYLNENGYSHIQDESNYDTTFNRNFLRNVVMKEIVKRWPNAVKALTNFSKNLAEDDEYINSHIREDAVIRDNNVVQIPCSCFLYPNSVVSRTIFKAFAIMKIKQDIERKHIEMVKDLALHGENGKKIKLPNSIVVSKEYDYITIHNNKKEKPTLNQEFKSGEFEVPGLGKVCVKRVRDFDINHLDPDSLYFDFRKVPKTAKWRFREDGDVFEKFGGGTKKLKSYLVDKKVPQRLRNLLPVLADGNEVYVIAGVEISDKVKIDSDLASCCRVEIVK